MAVTKIKCSWISANSLDRHRPVFMAIQISLFFIGVVFWIDAMNGGDGFDRDTWGWLAYSFPAKGWAFVNMATAAITAIGLMRPVKGWMVSVGAAVHVCQFIILSYSAVLCGGVFVVGLYASAFFLPLHLWLLIEALLRD